MKLSKEEAQNNLSLYRLEAFIDGIPGSVYWKDKRGIYMGCNNTVIRKGNLESKNCIIGKTDYDIWPEMAEAIRKADIEVMQQDKTLEFEETVVLKSGERLYFSSVKSPLKDDAGNIIGVMGNSLDITELKQAKQIAESASQAKTQFLALMSHELRLPLTGIISTASMLEDEEISTQEANEFGKIISSSGSYLLATIDNILDFAKLEANKLELVLTPVNLSVLIEEVTTILSATARAKNLKLTVAYDPVLPQNIISDSRALRHILTNLLGNAIKYTEKGSITLSVNSLLQTPESVILEIAVEDTGIGIPANKVDYIFDRFAQVENAYTRKSSRQGTGLGLSIVKKLVELLGGEIRVTSKIGKGSKFYFNAEFQIEPNSCDKTPWERWSELQEKFSEGKS